MPLLFLLREDYTLYYGIHIIRRKMIVKYFLKGFVHGFAVTIGTYVARKTTPVLDAGLDKTLGKYKWYKKKKTKKILQGVCQTEA